MVKSKSFSITQDNPASIFTGNNEPQEREQLEEQNGTEETEPVEIKKGYVLVKEAKSKRLQLLIRPTTHQLIKQIAKKNKTSVNDLINEILENYLEESENNGK